MDGLRKWEVESWMDVRGGEGDGRGMERGATEEKCGRIETKTFVNLLYKQANQENDRIQPSFP